VVTFKSSKPITKEQAIAAIGKKAKKYVVTGVEKSDG
jgi:hypothetical protein